MGNYCTARRNDGPLHKRDTNGKWHALWHPCRGGICMTSSWYLLMNPKLWTECCWSLQISCDPTLNGNLSWSLLNKDWELYFTPSTCRKTILPRPYYPEFRKNREPNTTNNDGFLYAKTQNIQEVASSCEFMHESKNPLHPCVVLGFPDSQVLNKFSTRPRRSNPISTGCRDPIQDQPWTIHNWRCTPVTCTLEQQMLQVIWMDWNTCK